MIWVSIIFGALELLLNWLINKKKAGGILTDDQQRKLNGLVYRSRQVEDAGVALGCKPGGEPTMEGILVPDQSFQSLPTDPEAMRSKIVAGIDKALTHKFIVYGDTADLMRAQRAYWSAAPVAELQKLISFLQES